MNNTMSRIDRLWEKLEKVASKGNWSYQTILYPSELRRIERQWHVSVQKLKPEDEEKAYICLISWNNAFPEGMNYQQSWYISQLLDEMPQVSTPAQKLFLIAARA